MFWLNSIRKFIMHFCISPSHTPSVRFLSLHSHPAPVKPVCCWHFSVTFSAMFYSHFSSENANSTKTFSSAGSKLTFSSFHSTTTCIYIFNKYSMRSHEFQFCWTLTNNCKVLTSQISTNNQQRESCRVREWIVLWIDFCILWQPQSTYFFSIPSPFHRLNTFLLLDFEDLWHDLTYIKLLHCITRTKKIIEWNWNRFSSSLTTFFDVDG